MRSKWNCKGKREATNLKIHIVCPNCKLSRVYFNLRESQVGKGMVVENYYGSVLLPFSVESHQNNRNNTWLPCAEYLSNARYYDLPL